MRHVRSVLLSLLLALSPTLARAARADSSLDVQSWLDKAGVRAVVVEFYASWCGPCMKAMPRWKELQRRYGKEGLRIIVVNTRDEEDPGKCTALGWTPDGFICDTEGVIAEKFGVSVNGNPKLPSAFLWSWDHKLLVQRGEVDEVEGAVERLFASLPRVELNADSDVPKEVVDEVAGALGYTAKMRVVASEAERQKLRAMRVAQQSAHVSDDSKCEMGKELAPNSSLGISLGRDSVRLKLLDLESGCVTQTASGRTAKDAVENLIGRLRVPLEWPSGGPRSAPASRSVVSETRLGAGSNDFDVQVTEQVVAQFESEPAGAAVLFDGKVICKETPCTKSVSTGRHDVTMSLDMYDNASQTVNVTKANKKTRLVLPPAFATLTVETVPPGMPVEIDGKPVGSGPQTVRLEPGPHDVMVRDRCFLDAGERIVLKKGDGRSVRIEPLPRLSALQVTAEDERGNDLEADVEVDGKAIGSTPLTAKVATCSREVVVTASGGRSWKQALSLRERETQSVVAKPKSSGSCPRGMVFIPGGSFDMGSNDGDSDERPVHRVTLSGFCMDVTEYAEADGNPKGHISWDEAKALCERQGKRLPTEAEWEFAARGPSGRKYPWGNGEPTCDRANYAECGNRAKRVGSLPAGATPEGLQDMAGNVWEWVADCYEGYVLSPQNNRSKEQCSRARVYRGGGWDGNDLWLRASNRSGDDAGSRSGSLGFRCARGMGP